VGPFLFSDTTLNIDGDTMPKLIRELLVGAAGSLIASAAIWGFSELFLYIQ
jgi:hypothetical protein